MFGEYPGLAPGQNIEDGNFSGTEKSNDNKPSFIKKPSENPHDKTLQILEEFYPGLAYEEIHNKIMELTQKKNELMAKKSALKSFKLSSIGDLFKTPSIESKQLDEDIDELSFKINRLAGISKLGIKTQRFAKDN